jgi:hypothetical protein
VELKVVSKAQLERLEQLDLMRRRLSREHAERQTGNLDYLSYGAAFKLFGLAGLLLDDFGRRSANLSNMSLEHQERFAVESEITRLRLSLGFPASDREFWLRSRNDPNLRIDMPAMWRRDP